MARRKKVLGLGERLIRLRLRLGFLSAASFAREVFSVGPSTYHRWEVRDAAPDARTLKRGLKSLRVWGWKDLLAWLADGEDPPPPWLDDESLDPRAPEPGGPSGGGGVPKLPVLGRDVIAFPRVVFDRCREAFGELDEARAAGELREPRVLRAYVALEGVQRELESQDSEEEEEDVFDSVNRRKWMLFLLTASDTFQPLAA